MTLQVGVKVLLRNQKNEYLLIRRKEAFSDGATWDIPGGRIDPAEKLEDALNREIQEEIGITVDGSKKLLSAQDIFVEAKDLHVVRLTYLAEYDGAIKLGDEHLEYIWIAKDSLVTAGLDKYLEEVVYALDSDS